MKMMIQPEDSNEWYDGEVETFSGGSFFHISFDNKDLRSVKLLNHEILFHSLAMTVIGYVQTSEKTYELRSFSLRPVKTE